LAAAQPRVGWGGWETLAMSQGHTEIAKHNIRSHINLGFEFMQLVSSGI
jgi:hypothetical protein